MLGVGGPRIWPNNCGSLSDRLLPPMVPVPVFNVMSSLSWLPLLSEKLNGRPYLAMLPAGKTEYDVSFLELS